MAAWASVSVTCIIMEQIYDIQLRCWILDSPAVIVVALLVHAFLPVLKCRLVSIFSLALIALTICDQCWGRDSLPGGIRTRMVEN